MDPIRSSIIHHNSFKLKAKNADPTGDELDFWIKNELIEAARKHEIRYFNALLIPETLKNPIAIFKGLERDNHEDGWCYCGKPSKRRQHWDETTTVPFPDGKIFLVFADKNRFVFNWRMEKENHYYSGLPKNFETRFGQTLWMI